VAARKKECRTLKGQKYSFSSVTDSKPIFTAKYVNSRECTPFLLTGINEGIKKKIIGISHHHL
jgi:hypothetical protein